MSIIDMEDPDGDQRASHPGTGGFRARVRRGGMYNSVSEVVRSGLRLLKEQEDRKRSFDAMIAGAVRETDEKDARTMDDVLARANAAIESAGR